MGSHPGIMGLRWPNLHYHGPLEYVGEEHPKALTSCSLECSSLSPLLHHSVSSILFVGSCDVQHDMYHPSPNPGPCSFMFITTFFQDRYMETARCSDNKTTCNANTPGVSILADACRCSTLTNYYTTNPEVKPGCSGVL